MPGQKIHKSVADLWMQSMIKDNLGVISDAGDSSSDMANDLRDVDVTDKHGVGLSNRSIQDELEDDPSYHLPGSYIQGTKPVSPASNNSTKSYIPAALLYDKLKWSDIDKNVQGILEDDPYTSAVTLVDSAFGPNTMPDGNAIITLSSLASNRKSASLRVNAVNSSLIFLKSFPVDCERCWSSVLTGGTERCRKAFLRDVSTRGRHRLGSRPTSLLFTHNYRCHHCLTGF